MPRAQAHPLAPLALLALLAGGGCEAPCQDSRDCPQRRPYCVEQGDAKVCSEVRTIPAPDVIREGVDAGGAPRRDGGL